MKIEKSTKSIITIYPLSEIPMAGDPRIEISLPSSPNEKIKVLFYTSLTLDEIRLLKVGLERAIEICESGGIDLPQD